MIIAWSGMNLKGKQDGGNTIKPFDGNDGRIPTGIDFGGGL